MHTTRPNILLISTDQQRGDCLGIDGHPVLQTPNLDHLAASGTRFRRGYSECPSCVPARRSLMSGMSPAAQGMVGFRTGMDWQPGHTLAGELQKAGYQTHMVGKLHLHPPRKRYGFDSMLLADTTRGANNDYVDWLTQTHNRHESHAGVAHGISANGWIGRPHHLPEHQTHTFWCVDRAIEFLDKRDPTVPFFLNVSMVDPHPPLTPPTIYYDRYVGRELPAAVVGDWAKGRFDRPQRGLNPDSATISLDAQAMHYARAAYYGMINFIDDQIGRLFQAMGRAAGNTFVAFVSDHGEMLGDHHLFRKTFPYEASARIPFLMRAPASWGLPSEVVSDGPVGLQDVMPTLLDAAGLDVPAACTGKSLLPVLRGEAHSVRDVLHGEHAGCYAYEHGNHFLVGQRYKYVWYSQTGQEQLFDLQADPQEERDLALTDEGAQRLVPWREKLVEALCGRPEGFTDGRQLITGREHRPMVPGV